MKIRNVRVRDIRFPTSRHQDGSDALNLGDYSATYVILETDGGLEGHGLTFTNGRGNEICVAAVHALAPHVAGRDLDGILADLRAFYRELTVDKQLRWLGPEKGILHMATGAVINAVWDLWAKREGKPVWKLLVDLTPEQIVAAIDFSYITDVLTPEQALETLRRKAAGKAAREAEMRRDGYPAYTTSTGWLGYPDEKVRRLCKEALAQGWTAFKMKVGQSLEDNERRAALMREEIGASRKLMMDANQCWDVDEAIRQMKAPRPLRPLVDRGADQPRRRARARRHRQGHRPHRGGHRRGVPEPRDLQAAPAGRRHPLPARSTPAAWAGSTRSSP